MMKEIGHGIRWGVLALGLSMLATPAMAIEKGDVLLRVGITHVRPNDSSSVITTAATGPLAGTAAHVGNETQPGINLVYLLTDNVGVELLAATPFEHGLKVSGLSQYGFKTTHLGSTKQLPPTVSALYYFGPTGARLRPYVGAGLNYTTFFQESLSRDARSELAARGLSLDDSFGLSVRAGFDWEVNERWLVNASLWNIKINTDAHFSSALGKVRAKVDVDPYVTMLSVGYKF